MTATAATDPTAQAAPQLPQFDASVCRSTQAFPQTSGREAGHAQAPATQTAATAATSGRLALAFMRDTPSRM